MAVSLHRPSFQRARGQESHRPHLTLNTDGRRHPKENALAFVALGCGILSLLCATTSSLATPGAALGLIGAVVAAYDQMISATTAERWLIVPAGVASFVGFGLNMAHGAF